MRQSWRVSAASIAGAGGYDSSGKSMSFELPREPTRTIRAAAGPDHSIVIPAKAGIQGGQSGMVALGFRFRGNDE